MNKGREAQLQTKLTKAHYGYEKGLNIHAFFKMHNHAMGEDLVQNTFIKTWIHLLKGGKVSNMKAFLYHVLNNLIIDEYRKEKHKAISLDNLLEKGFKPRSADSEERLFNTLDGEKTLLLIKLLPLKYQKMIDMRYIKDLSTKEISSLTGQSRNAIAVQTHRGLLKLKILYNKALSSNNI